MYPDLDETGARENYFKSDVKGLNSSKNIYQLSYPINYPIETQRSKHENDNR